MNSRVLLISLTVALRATSRSLIYSMLTVANILILFLHMLLQPYANPRDNMVENFSLSILAIVTATLTPLDAPLSWSASIGMSFLVLVPMAIFFVMVAIARIKRLHAFICRRKNTTNTTVADKGDGSSGSGGPLASLEDGTFELSPTAINLRKLSSKGGHTDAPNNGNINGGLKNVTLELASFHVRPKDSLSPIEGATTTINNNTVTN
jgi:hypothetical protein